MFRFQMVSDLVPPTQGGSTIHGARHALNMLGLDMAFEDVSPAEWIFVLATSPLAKNWLAFPNS